jgi:hypothetical protein
VSLISGLGRFIVPSGPRSVRSIWSSERLPLSMSDGIKVRPHSEEIHGNWEVLCQPLIL